MDPLQLQVPEGIQFIDPDAMLIRRAGDSFDAPRSSFWRRRLNEGTVVEKKPAASQTGSAKKGKTA